MLPAWSGADIGYVQRNEGVLRHNSPVDAIAFADPTVVILRAEASTGEMREDVNGPAAEPRGVALSPKDRPRFEELGTRGR